MGQSHQVNTATAWQNHRRTLLLICVLFACAGWYYWSKFYQPMKTFTQAKETVTKNPYIAEKLAALAISEAGGNFPEAQFFRAELLGQLGHWDESLGQFSLIEHPETLPAKKLCAFAREAQHRGFDYLAERIFQAAKHDSTLRPQILRSLIQIHLHMGKEELAKTECLELLKLVPDDGTAWQVLGTVSMNQKLLADSEKAFRKCLEISEDQQQKSAVREDLIQVLIDIGNLKKARHELEILRKTSTELSDRFLIEEAWILRMEGNPTQGIKVIEPLIANDSKLVMKAYLLRGMMHNDIGQNDAARDDLEKVVATQPWNKEAHHKLAVIYTHLKDGEKAAKHRIIADQLTNQALELLKLKEALIAKPDNFALRERVAHLYKILGQHEQARHLLSQKTTDPESWNQ